MLATPPVRPLVYALYAWTLFAAFGCGGTTVPRCERTETIALRLRPAVHLNPDRQGLPRSVVLRLYQLGDERTFRARSFESVWNEPVRGTDAQPDQVIAIPGRRQSHALPRDPKAKFLAATARNLEHRGDSEWRALVRLPEAKNACARSHDSHDRPLEIVLADYGLRLSSQ